MVKHLLGFLPQIEETLGQYAENKTDNMAAAASEIERRSLLLSLNIEMKG